MQEEALELSHPPPTVEIDVSSQKWDANTSVASPVAKQDEKPPDDTKPAGQEEEDESDRESLFLRRSLRKREKAAADKAEEPEGKTARAAKEIPLHEPSIVVAQEVVPAVQAGQASEKEVEILLQHSQVSWTHLTFS